MLLKKIYFNMEKNIMNTRILKHFMICISVAAVFLVSSCYYYPAEQVITQPAPHNENITAITQIYFYPNNNQSAEQQSRDHYACYNWAVDQTGFDPGASAIEPQQRVRVVPMPPPGQDTVAMSIAGAVLGALIGGPHHAVEGAFIGSTYGALAGAASDLSRQEYARQMEEAYQNRNQARDFHKEKKALQFRRAMSACMEGRGYTIK